MTDDIMVYPDDLTKCPYCGNSDIEEYQDCSPVELTIRIQKCKCNHCLREWYEEYEFVRRLDIDCE